MIGNIFLSRTALEPLACHQNVDGSYQMAAAPIMCNRCPSNSTLTTSSVFGGMDEYRSLRKKAIVCATLYGLGSPLLFFGVLYSHRDVLKKNQFQNGFGFLTTKMREEYYFWEVVISLRKLLLVFGATMFAKENKVPSGLWTIFVTVSALIAQVQATPFASTFTILRPVMCILCISLTLYCLVDKDANIAECCMLVATMLVPILALGQRSCATQRQVLCSSQSYPDALVVEQV
jgi:hypothetical protein